MTEQEKRIQEQTEDAIEVLNFLKKDFENKAKPRHRFARVRAGLFYGIKALEKQMPKKPYLETKGLLDVKMWHCPVCKKEVASDWNRDLANTYCHHCGQKLDWE